MRRPLFVLLLVVAACGGGPEPEDLPDGPLPVDASPPPFVGSWRELPPVPVPVEDRALLTISPNHQWVESVRGTTRTATWMLEADGRLTIRGGSGSYSAPYHLGADRLVRAAYQAQGPVSGLVGTWGVSERWDDSITIDTTLALAADMTATITHVYPDRTLRIDGTWRLEGVELIIDGTLDGEPHMMRTLVTDGVIGYPAYERFDF